MSDLTYYNYKGVGEYNAEHHGYSQAVRVGDTIQCSGQGTSILVPMTTLVGEIRSLRVLRFLHFTGGWDESGKFFREINQQIDKAFENVDLALKTAGGKGWEQVFRVNSYHVPLNGEAQEAMTRNFKKWMPNHKPLWTCVGVTRLGEDDMRVEVEVQAYDPKK
ncbi:hypothetical protein L202_00844 [Cryptococcus amylolentus CBS 6039]|uniref:Uncharacterized protein n=1 Tax=Cryptococcus amylolentus CBS 6039 TaxID=1295533 RepID=A0A1E3I8W6_9TREE|nr:hypothetical protein L202_00844 [Cryptococcus amylolentus CBS 6039]ODN85012.1 hypothetical protein L202_00844 [Cryptococcus amylolentus CBS 6039]